MGTLKHFHGCCSAPGFLTTLNSSHYFFFPSTLSTSSTSYAKTHFPLCLSQTLIEEAIPRYFAAIWKVFPQVLSQSCHLAVGHATNPSDECFHTRLCRSHLPDIPRAGWNPPQQGYGAGCTRVSHTAAGTRPLIILSSIGG